MRIRILVSIVIACLAWAVVPPAHAVQPGSYRCWSYNVSGGGGSCRLAPPIVIAADGTYRESRAAGTYQVQGDRIVFSGSTIRGPGIIEGGNRIRFEYDYNGFRHTVTYLCQDCPAAPSSAAPPSRPPAASAKPAPAAAGASVDLSLKLRFDASEGDMGWAATAHLVPVRLAAEFLAGGALAPPPGSSTGLAWTEGKSVVATRFRSARAGERCSVILDAGRERLAVADLVVAPSPEVQEVVLPASLKHGVPAASDAQPPGGRGATGAGSGIEAAGTGEGAAGDGFARLGAALEELGRALGGQPSQASAGASQAAAAPPIGVQITDVTPEIAGALKSPGLKGAGVVKVLPDSPAFRGGVRDGDVIVAVNGFPVESASTAKSLLSGRNRSFPVALRVFRPGRYVSLDLKE